MFYVVIFLHLTSLCLYSDSVLYCPLADISLVTPQLFYFLLSFSKQVHEGNRIYHDHGKNISLTFAFHGEEVITTTEEKDFRADNSLSYTDTY